MTELIMIKLVLSIVHQVVGILTHWVGKIITIIVIVVVTFFILKYYNINAFQIIHFFIKQIIR
ncbi:hypothetical protein N42HA_02829 [Lactococcus lactis]|nr:hypothetical protein [Lactococcus lactis]